MIESCWALYGAVVNYWAACVAVAAVVGLVVFLLGNRGR